MSKYSNRREANYVWLPVPKQKYYNQNDIKEKQDDLLESSRSLEVKKIDTFWKKKLV